MRLCKCGCGKPLIKRLYESTGDFAKRKYASRECAGKGTVGLRNKKGEMFSNLYRYQCPVDSIPLPKFDYSRARKIQFLERCPVCRGTVRSHNGTQVCGSCDYTWSRNGDPLGVVEGAGII